MNKIAKLSAAAMSTMFLVFAFAACGDSSSDDETGGGGNTSAANNCMVDDKYNPAFVCKTYGAAVPAVVDTLIGKATTDAKFKDDFQIVVDGGDTRVAEFRTNLINFITDAYGCTTGTYKGPDMVAAHANLAIDEAHYGDFVGLIVASLAENGVPEEDINNCFAPPVVPGSALADSIINK